METELSGNRQKKEDQIYDDDFTGRNHSIHAVSEIKESSWTRQDFHTDLL